jgi:hypothetical protein
MFKESIFNFQALEKDFRSHIKMETKTVIKKWDSEKDSFQKFVTSVLKDQKVITKKTKIPYLNESTEYFITEEFQVTLVQGENNFYEFEFNPLPLAFDLKYGCELETCFVLNCNVDQFNDFLAKKIKEKKDEENYMEKRKKWEELIMFHIKNNLVPYFSKEFLKRFPYAYIMAYHSQQAIYIDLATGEEIFKSKEVDDYKSIQFAQDASVECGDTNFQDTSLTVHCEIISPILNDLQEIKLIYENLISEDCNSSNSSAGYHVNVSIVDKNEKGSKNEPKTIKLTPGILFEICKQWYPFEKKHYTEYRGQGTVYAKNLSQIADDTDLMKVFYETKDKTEMKDDDIVVSDKKYGLRNLFYMYQIYDKYTSLHIKPEHNVLEFRVFPSKNKMDLLIDYTKKALSIIRKSMQNVIENYEEISYNYNYLLSKYQPTDYIDFNKYKFKGSLRIYKKLVKMFEDEDDFSIFFKRFSTNIESEELQTTTFLFFFKETNSVKTIKTISGLTVGIHEYFWNGKVTKQTLNVTYLPDEDFIEVSDFKSIYVGE